MRGLGRLRKSARADFARSLPLEPSRLVVHPQFMSSGSGLEFYDAHNHLQDERFGGRQVELIRVCAALGIAKMVVNGACEEDWPRVLELARAHSVVLPSFGYHPWYVPTRSPAWADRLRHFLDAVPAAVGEIGLDRWKPGLLYASQEEVFQTQLQIAAARNLPVTIHCLQAWGRLLELLRSGPLPRRGFLLHSFGGPREMVPELASLGAYFSFPGYFLHARKTRQRETFEHIPAHRLLLETDAPDQPLPRPQDALPEVNLCGRAGLLADSPQTAPRDPLPALDGAPSWAPHYLPLTDPVTGGALNHPGNLVAVYHGLAAIRRLPLERLATTVQENFQRLFGGV